VTLEDFVSMIACTHNTKVAMCDATSGSSEMEQSDWHFCGKCFAMFFDGDPANKGACPADGGNHSGNGVTFTLPHDIPEAGNGQAQWRFCQNCFAMFFDGDPNRKGVCDKGGGHVAQGFMFVLPHDVPAAAGTQPAWRFCEKDFVMFFDGAENKGSCAAGGGHSAQGFMFVLPHLNDFVLNFNTGPLTSNLPLGGSAHLLINETGAFTLNTHAHDSGADNIDYTMAVTLASPEGVAFTFGIQGGVEGTTAGLPFGTPRRDDDQTKAGTNADITKNFDAIRGATLVGALVGTDTLTVAFDKFVNDFADAAVKQLGTGAAAAVTKLL
jgi:hypothetical protein